MRSRLPFNSLEAVAYASAAVLSPATLLAQSDIAVRFDMPPQPLDRALRQVARQTGAEIMFTPNQVAGVLAPRLTGEMTTMQAVEHLIANTGLVAEKSASAIVIRGRAHTTAENSVQDVPRADAIIVTGSRIRGATVASPTTVMTRNDIHRAGQSNLGEAMRSLPQNFNGGQNPAIGMGTGGSPDNINVSSGATFNLRGIGQDATLTLLNGHRVAYNAANQGVDVSAIPLAAIERMEVVSDGSSALYGSDAVGGVVNIILRRDFDGVWTSARLGTSTDGGGFQQQYSVVGGSTWNGGGLIATYDFGRDTAIKAGRRSYASGLNPDQTLVPFMRRHSAIISAHQEILSDLDFNVDATFNARRSHYETPINPTGPLSDFGLSGFGNSTSYSIAPSLNYRFAPDWRVTLLGIYGEDKTRYGSDLFVGGTNVSPTRGCYCNALTNADLSFEGPIVQLPGGAARLAIGGGYREIGFHAFRTQGSVQDVNEQQNVYYAFGELYLPIVSRDQDLAGISSLSLSGALRYENYTGIDRIVTPKFGLVYAPVADIRLKATWGKSFRAPTLYQQYAVQYASLYPAASLGGSSFPGNSSAILLDGANTDLKSERATSWTMTAEITPTSWPGFHAEVSYYHIDYRDRVAAPISGIQSALANQAYRQLITYAPTASAVTGIISNPDYIFSDYTGSAFDSSNVVAIVDNRSRNIARQTIQGVDVSLRYKLGTARAGAFTFLGNVTYLDSKQRLIADEVAQDIAGVIFYPPHVRGRAGLLWDKGPISLSAYVNYVGGVRDERATVATRVSGMTTLDMSAVYKVDAGAGVLRDMEILVSIQNISNVKPDLIRTSASYFPPYDSTNYSPVGRFVSLTISKSW